jgi:hypothetical protein
MQDLKKITRRAIVAVLGCAFVANGLIFLPLAARADGDKKGDGKKIIIVVGPITKTPDKHK